MKRSSQHYTALFRTIKTCAVMVLLALYVLTSLRVNDLHRITHDQEHAVDHSPAEESNLCHQTLYHAVAKACDHDFHITEDKSCSLCDALVHHSHILETTLTASLILSSGCDESIYSLSVAESTDYTSSDRGPPVA